MHQRVVIRKAALLLEDPSLSILDIAMEIGYQSPSKFSTAFYNVYGVTPMQYRQQILSGNVMDSVLKI